MRQRTLKPGFFKNEYLAEMAPLERLLFAGLLLLADRSGRFEDRPTRIRAEILPYEFGVDVDGMLTALERRGFIRRYIVHNVRYGLIPKFVDHQHPHPKEPASLIPAPVELHGEAAKGNCETLSRPSVPSGSSIPSGPSGPADEMAPPAKTDPSKATDSRATDEIDRLDSDLQFEERRFTAILAPLHRDGFDVQAILDELPRKASMTPLSASRWIRTGLTGLPRTDGGLAVLRITNDALEARQRAQEAPIVSANNRQAFDAIGRVTARLKARRDGTPPPKEIEG